MIELRNVSKAFGSQQILEDVSLRVEEGEKLCVIGKSGSGKSVMMKLMTGLHRVDAGQVLVDGADVTQYDRKAWATLLQDYGVVFQGAALFDSLTVLENVGIRLFEARTAREDEIRSRVSTALEQVGLRPEEVLHKYPSELSGGMQKRVGIARAIVHRPRFVFYDEPTTGLDPVNSQIIDNLIQSLSTDPKRTSIIITHDMHTVRQIASRVAMIHACRLHYYGTPEGLFQSQDPVIRQFLDRSVQGFDL